MAIKCDCTGGIGLGECAICQNNAEKWRGFAGFVDETKVHYTNGIHLSCFLLFFQCFSQLGAWAGHPRVTVLPVLNDAWFMTVWA